MKITILEYGTGNLHTLRQALADAGASVDVTSDATALLAGDAVVLPAVGVYGAAAAALENGMPALRAAFLEGKPCLGIGVGMQLLLESSEEGPGAGLGIVAGRSRKLAGRRVPHTGWNTVVPAEHSASQEIFGGARELYGYFTNACVAEPTDASDVVAWCDHEGHPMVAAIRRGNTWGFQFQAEKSGRAGVELVHAFVRAARG